MSALLNNTLQGITSVDTDVLLFLNHFHNPFFDDVMYIISGKLIWIPLYLIVAFIVYKNGGLKRFILCGLMIALAVTLSDQICASLIRPIVERLRPANLENPIHQYVHIVDGYRGGRFSFPSCHAANTFALVFFLALYFRSKKLTIFMFVWALIVSYSRIYLGVHYPGDILAGIVVGGICATISYKLLIMFTHGNIRSAKAAYHYIPNIEMIILSSIIVYSFGKNYSYFFPYLSI